MNTFLPSLRELTLLRFRTVVRDPGTLTWLFLFPVVLTLAGAVLFGELPAHGFTVAVVDDAAQSVLAGRLEQTGAIGVERLDRATAEDRLRRGQVALVVVAGDPPELVLSEGNPEGRTARLAVEHALEQRAEGPGLFAVREAAPGSRYVDFLMPGVLAFSMASTSLFGIGIGVVQMRSGRLLKRMRVSPMSPSAFLGSWLLWRLAFAVAEMIALVAVARLVLDVKVLGGLAPLFVFGLFGTLCFSALALLLASRAENVETVEGHGRLFHLSAMVLSGVFFSTSNFPDWLQPIVRLHPTTALTDGFRAIVVDGASLQALGPESAILAVWGVLSFVVASRTFRWT